MDFNIKPTNSTQPITADIAQQVYELIKEHGNSDLAFKKQPNSLIEPEHFKIVDKEIDKVFNRISALVTGTVVIEQGYPSYEDDEGVIHDAVSPVYFIPNGKTDFKAQLSSELLDTFTLLKDFVALKGFDYTTQWDTFLNTYHNEGI